MRQTTSVPFLKIAQGTRYTEVGQYDALGRKKKKAKKHPETFMKASRSNFSANFTSHVMKEDFHAIVSSKLKTEPDHSTFVATKRQESPFQL